MSKDSQQKHSGSGHNSGTDSASYLSKKAFYQQAITLYGRKPVLEALQDHSLNIHRIHLASSNKTAAILDNIKQLATARDVEIHYHNKKELSRISRNSKQDQGVAADILCKDYVDYRVFLQQWLQQRVQQGDSQGRFNLIALDGISNPQNLGMIIRSACAGFVDGILLAKKNNAAISPLVVKASAGTVFRTRILRCEHLPEALAEFKQAGAAIYCLSSHAQKSLFELHTTSSGIYVLGNESDGVSRQVQAIADHDISIPMNNGVESLNVAVTASLIAFQPYFYSNRKPEGKDARVNSHL